MVQQPSHGVGNFVCTRNELAAGTATDETARRASALAQSSRILTSFRFVRGDGAGRFDIWLGSDPAVLHTQVTDADAPVDGMLIERAAVPLALGNLLVREMGRWPLGAEGSMDVTTVDELTDAVQQGRIRWAIVASRADREHDRVDAVQVVASDGSNLLAGSTGSSALTGTPVTVALGRLLALTATDE